LGDHLIFVGRLGRITKKKHTSSAATSAPSAIQTSDAMLKQPARFVHEEKSETLFNGFHWLRD